MIAYMLGWSLIGVNASIYTLAAGACNVEAANVRCYGGVAHSCNAIYKRKPFNHKTYILFHPSLSDTMASFGNEHLVEIAATIFLLFPHSAELTRSLISHKTAMVMAGIAPDVGENTLIRSPVNRSVELYHLATRNPNGKDRKVATMMRLADFTDDESAGSGKYYIKVNRRLQKISQHGFPIKDQPRLPTRPVLATLPKQ
eukprot:scaffold140_cov163-Amphora_coffeaeformis.AAC.1